MAVDPVLDILLDLDRLEKDRQASERAVGDLPEQIAAREKGLESRRKTLSLLQKNIEARELELYAASNQVIARNAEINRLQESLAVIGNNREYEALHAGIMRQQESLGQLTQQQNKLRSELDLLRSDFSARQQEWQALEFGAYAELDSLRAALSRLESERADLSARIARRLEALPAHIAKDWTQLAQGQARRPLDSLRRSLVSPMGPSDTHCKVCYTELTRQVLRALKEAGEVLSCPVCGAFLVSQNPSEKRLA